MSAEVVQTVNGTIRVEDGVFHCESRATFGSAFMMVGMVFVLAGIVIVVVQGSAGPALLAIPLGLLWIAVVWYTAGGRFGSFVVDVPAGELRRADGSLIAPLDEVRFSVVSDITDGMNFWTGRACWLTAKCRGLTNVYRLGKMSRQAAQDLAARMQRA